jgi:hypothetical protein
MKSRITLVLVLFMIVAVTALAGCGKKTQTTPQENEPNPVNYNEVKEFFPAGELNRQVDGDIRPAMQEVFGGIKLATIFALQNGQVVEDVNTPEAGRHLVYIIPRPAAEDDTAAIVAQLEKHASFSGVTSGTSGMMRTISYAREVEGELYRVSIGYRPGDQQIGISVYPMSPAENKPEEELPAEDEGK